MPYNYAQSLKYIRTEYGKCIRKKYEQGIIKERRCNMRELTPRKDGVSNTITTVLKDNYIIEEKLPPEKKEMPKPISASTNKVYELVNFCEFDKFAAKSYCAVHDVDESLNLGDITKVDETSLKPFNMICGGSPCQDFSISGKQAGSKWKCLDCSHEYNPLTVHYSKRCQCPNCGSENLSKTRSSLLVEWLRVIRVNKPRWGIYENVKNIVGKQFKETFQMFLNELHEYGYNTYFQVLNAKDYGVPQNRERVYLIIILKEFDNGKFKFPEPFDNGLRLKDILEDEVDEKYYINTPQAKALVDKLLLSGKLDKEISNTVGGRRI